MSRVRYIFALVLAAVAFVFFLIVDFAEGFEKIAIAYLVAAAVAELVWWDSFAVRIPLFLLRIFGIVFLFWGGLLFSGLLMFIIAILIATPVFTALASILGGAVTVLLFLSAVLFPIHVVAHARDSY